MQEDHTYNYTLRQRRSDETLRETDRHDVFIRAVVEGQVPRVLNFLRMGVDLDETGSSDLTALHRAILSGHAELLEPLIQAGADVNAASEDFGTPLCLAALKGMYKSVKTLLKYKAKPRIVTKKVGTALHCCVASTEDQKPIITALLEAGANITTQATLDTQWLHAVCEWDGDDRNQIGSPLHVKAGVLHDTTPAFVAVQLARVGLLELLLPPDLDHVFRVGVPKLEVVDGSIPPPIRTSTSGLQNETDGVLLHTYTSGCARTGDLAGVEYLLAKGAKFDLHDDTAATPLMVAAGQGHIAIATLLLDHGAPIDRRIGTGLTALHCAVSSNQAEMIRVLCERGASIEMKDNKGCTALSYATCNRDRPDIVKVLCEHGATVDVKGNMGHTTLHLAAAKGYDKIVRALCEHGANVDAKADGGSTPLLLAIAAGHADTVRLLCERGATVNAKNPYGATPLHLARNHRIIRTLCEHGAPLDTKDNNGNTPFWTAVFLLTDQGAESSDDEAWNFFQALIDVGCDINSRDSHGYTPLLRIVKGSKKIDTALIEKLIRAGANTWLRARDGTSFLRLCFTKRFAEVLFRTAARAREFDEGTVDLVYARLVLFCGIFSNMRNREQRLIFFAAGNGHEHLRLLLSLGNYIDVGDDKGRTAMHLAAQLGDCISIKRLLAAGALLDPMTKGGHTPLAFAIMHRQTEVVRELLAHGADPYPGGSRDGPPNALRLALEQGDREILDLVRSTINMAIQQSSPISKESRAPRSSSARASEPAMNGISSNRDESQVRSSLRNLTLKQ